MSLRRAILERRIPQFLALYMGVSWGLVQFVNFLEDRYQLSPHLTDVTLLAVALLIPSVIVFTYNHGRPGKDEWSRVEKFGIPLNLFIALVVLVVVFRGKQLGATVSTITTQDEGGQTITRKVANASYRKRAALFNFDGVAGDTSVAWLQYGLPIAIATDLSQDKFIDLRVSGLFREKLRQMGFRDEVNVPLTLKRTIASEQHLPFFTAGKVARSGDTIVVDFALHESARGGLVQRRVYRGTDVFALVDEITAGLKRDLEIPETADVPDLAVSEVLTHSQPAFRQFVDAVNAMQFRNEWQQAAQRLERSVAQDPSFALAWLNLHSVYLLSNQGDRAMPPLQKALDHVYRLPERLQYDVKVEYYMMKQDQDRAYQAANTRVALFPDDISGYLLLAQLQSLRGDRDGMIASLNKVMELDPTQQERLREIGALYEAKGDIPNALRYYTQYTERFPGQFEAFVLIGNLQRQRGELAAARTAFNQALVLAPAEVAPLLGLARLDRDQGNFDAALKQLQDALTAARTSKDSANALDGLSDYYEFRGQLERAASYALRSHDEMARTQPPLEIALRRLGTVELYARAGQFDAARTIVQRVAGELQAPFNAFASLGEMRLQLELEKPDEAEQAIQRLEQAIQASGFQVLRYAAVIARGRLAELRNDCGRALGQYQEAQKLEPADVGVFTAIGRCYRVLNQPERATGAIGRTLQMVPASGRANYEIGLAYRDAGDRIKAVEHLQRALKTWESADPTHKLAAQARAALAQVEAMRLNR